MHPFRKLGRIFARIAERGRGPPDSTMTVNKAGTRYWHNAQGQIHREGGPAIQWADRSRAWCIKDQYHRTDGPAYEHPNGQKEWYINGKLHRLDGPAVENADGSRSWYVNGQRHRTDGAAFEGGSGYKEWWVNGEQLTEEQFNLRRFGPRKLSLLTEPPPSL